MESKLVPLVIVLLCATFGQTQAPSPWRAVPPAPEETTKEVGINAPRAATIRTLDMQRVVTRRRGGIPSPT